MSARGEPITSDRLPHVEWPAIFAGAVGAAGVSLTLHAFAAGVGLSVLSTAPTWRESSAGLWVLSGVYLVFVALCAFGFGGYVAGRMRAPLRAGTAESEFRDGMHGLLTWASAIVFTAVLALGTALTAAPAVAPGGIAGATQSVAGENTIASELDELFRGSRDGSNLPYHRAEAARILLKSSSHSGVSRMDRDALASIAASSTGLAMDSARERADRAVHESGQELHRARVAAVLQAFFIGAALLVGAAVAWFSACEGGREREAGIIPIWDWSPRRRSKV